MTVLINKKYRPIFNFNTKISHNPTINKSDSKRLDNSRENNDFRPKIALKH